MSLTKRLYRLDEVRAALVFCIKSKRLYEACFWLRELEESAQGPEARRILFLTWFLLYGLAHCSWLHAWTGAAETPEGRLKLCWQLCRCSERDTSLWWLFCAGAIYDLSSPKEQLSAVFDRWRGSYWVEYEEFWQPLVDASETERLDEILEGLQTDMGKYSLYARLAGLVLVASQKHIPKSSWGALSQEEPIELAAKQLEWNAPTTVRAARIFPIPQGCLYGLTWRGCGGCTTDELTTLTLKSFQKCTYWKQILAVYITGGQWNSDDALEEFYDTEFAGCDIPDEWPRRDREVSHGIYPLVNGSAPLWKWWNSWIGELPHKWIWGTIIDWVQDWTTQVQLNETGAVLELIAGLYTKREPIILGPPKKKEWVFSIPPLAQK